MKYNPPHSLPHDSWYDFEEEFRVLAPFRYAITKKIPRLINPYFYKLKRMKMWLMYRTTDKYHIVKTELKPGWHEFDERILYAAFSLLVDFVEKDKASLHQAWALEKDNLKWWQKNHIWFSFFYRSPESGIEHLLWEATLDDPTLPVYEQSPVQARHARETLVLYRWWKDRSKRKYTLDFSYDSQGCMLGALNKKFDKNAPDYIAYKKARDELDAKIAMWEKEDDEMLARLIEIRRSLWT